MSHDFQKRYSNTQAKQKAKGRASPLMMHYRQIEYEFHKNKIPGYGLTKGGAIAFVCVCTVNNAYSNTIAKECQK